ncbi:MAG: hypothetical protein M1831_004097 [Alyxoria varia]|nr:MAG: hypothetical protein M1831_004097 [Alyxoria varia]
MNEKGHHHIKPRLIVHGGAGNITRENLPPHQWEKYRHSLVHVRRAADSLLTESRHDALHVVTEAVRMLEDDPLFNAAKGAVFNRAGQIELEASVMVSSGQRKRSCAVSLLKHVKNPVTLAATMLRKGDEEGSGGAQGHVHLSGHEAENLGHSWGLEMTDENYFWTKKRWEEHKRGLQSISNVRKFGASIDLSDDIYLPQGTVGCVALDCYGTVAVATSTGGMTNKLPGRIGDTPTVGAGYWAEEWYRDSAGILPVTPSPLAASGMSFYRLFAELNPLPSLTECVSPSKSSYQQVGVRQDQPYRQAVAMSGTGNGDTFLRLAATRTVASLARFSSKPPFSLASAVNWMAGPGGQLQRSAQDRWGQGGEGEGGIIGIELVEGTDFVANVVFDFNCGGMFRCWMDESNQERCMVFREEY